MATHHFTGVHVAEKTRMHCGIKDFYPLHFFKSDLIPNSKFLMSRLRFTGKSYSSSALQRNYYFLVTMYLFLVLALFRFNKNVRLF